MVFRTDSAGNTVPPAGGVLRKDSVGQLDFKLYEVSL